MQGFTQLTAAVDDK